MVSKSAEWYRERIKDPAYKARETARSAEYRKARRADPVRWAAYLEKQRDRTRSRAGQHAKLRAANPIKYMVAEARKRAREKGLEFSLKETDIVIPETCPVLGITLNVGNTDWRGRDHSPSLDRIDNKLGYIPSNVMVISFRANRFKADATPDELRAVLAYVEANEF